MGEDSGLDKAIISVRRSFPDLLRELYEKNWRCDHPQLDTSFGYLAAKFALATYYNDNNKPADARTRIGTKWSFGQNAADVASIQTLLAGLSEQAHLQQGKWDTQDTFFLRYSVEGATLVLCAVFNESIALIAKLHDGEPDGGWRSLKQVWAPTSTDGIELVSAP